MKGLARARRRWMGDARCVSPPGAAPTSPRAEGQLTFPKIPYGFFSESRQGSRKEPEWSLAAINPS